MGFLEDAMGENHTHDSEGVCAMCSSGQTRTQMLLEMTERIEKYGYTSVWVAGPDNGPSCFCYTIGLNPELLIVGLEGRVCMNMFGGALQGDWPPSEGRLNKEDTIINGPYRVKYRRVGQAAMEHLMVCTTELRPDGFEAFQMLWPDPAGKHPGDEGVDKDYEHLQNGHDLDVKLP